MKTAHLYLEGCYGLSAPSDVYLLGVEVVDSEEPQYPQTLKLLFYDANMVQLPDWHYLYEAKRTGMLPDGMIACRSWERAEELVRDFLQQAGCPVDQIEAYADKRLFPDNFQVLFGWKDPGDILAEDLLAIIRRANRPTLRERIRDFYYRICTFLV